VGVYFADFGSFRFRGKKSSTVFESNKDGSHMVVFVTLFTTNFIEVQKCEKGVNFCWILIGGVCFHWN